MAIREKYNRGISKYINASMTVEASIIVPLFIFCMINLLFGLQVMETSSRITAALHETGNEICSYGYAFEKGVGDSIAISASSLVYVSSKVAKHLGPTVDKRGGIKGGISGISYLGSKIMTEGNIVKIVITYSLKFPVNMNIKTYRIRDSYYGHAWTGYDGNNYELEKISEDPIVYITPSGTVYHTNIQCSHLNPKLKATDINSVSDERNNSGAKYYACEICGNGINFGAVYITDYGNRYHVNTNCSGIKRNIFTVHLSEVGGRRACSTCG